MTRYVFHLLHADERTQADDEDVDSVIPGVQRLYGRGPRVVRRSTGDENNEPRYSDWSSIGSSQFIAVKDCFPRCPQGVASVLVMVAGRLTYAAHHRLSIASAAGRNLRKFMLKYGRPFSSSLYKMQQLT